MPYDPTGFVSHEDELHRSQTWKRWVRVASTGNLNLAAPGATIDGIAMAAGDRFLAKDQTAGAENGIRVWLGAAVAAPRAFDMDQDATTSVPGREVVGAIVPVITGTANGGKLFRCTNTAAPILGTTVLTFAELSASAAHEVDAMDAHDASAISVVPFSTIAATDVQAALEELLAEAGSGSGDSIGQFVVGWDGGGAVLEANSYQDVIAPFTGTITGWTLLADQSGSADIDIWKDTYANFPPTVADSITAAAPPVLSGATKAQSSTLTGWVTAVTVGQILRFNLDSATMITKLVLVLDYSRP